MPSERINVAYYVTGHGLGHATRSLELMRGLLLTERFRLFSISNVSASFFRSELTGSGVRLEDESGTSTYEHFERNLDSGGIQSDPVHMDTLATLDRYYTIHQNRTDLLKFEVEWLKTHNVRLVLLDATPLGSAAGRQAGALVVFVTNFTWDFVFREMLTVVKTQGLATELQLQAYAAMIAQCEEDVCCCHHIVRYPGDTPLPAAFDEAKILPGPLLCRPVRDFGVRDRFCSKDERLLLLGFGGFEVDWNLRDHFLPAGWRCIVLRARPQDLPSERFTAVPDDAYVPDLIHAADVVLGKIGYGFVSECLSAGTPLVFVPRVHWPEEPYMARPLTEGAAAGLSMPLSAFQRGEWALYIDRALRLRSGWPADPQHHSSRATGQVLAILEGLLQRYPSPSSMGFQTVDGF